MRTRKKRPETTPSRGAAGAKRLLACAAALLTALLPGCSSSIGPNAGSETTNGLAVAVVGMQLHGSADRACLVEVFSASFRPDQGSGFRDSLTLRMAGDFAFTLPAPGVYNVFASASASPRAAAVRDVTAPALDTAAAGADAFDSVAAITGTVLKSGAGAPLVTVYIPGTRYATVTDAQGGFSLDRVVSGTYQIFAEQVTANTKVPGQADTATVTAKAGSARNGAVLLELH